MKNMSVIILGAISIWWTAGAQPPANQPPLPSNHPPLPQMPSNHPPVPQMPPGHQATGDAPAISPTIVPAEPQDVESMDAIIGAYYRCLSGARGEKREWDRLRSLFVPDARFVTGRVLEDRVVLMTITLDQFIQMNQVYFEKGGYFEDEIRRHSDTFGNIAQVFSTYEARRGERESHPHSRGINSMQLLNDGSRWWIVSMMWDYERPDNPIPMEFERK